METDKYDKSKITGIEKHFLEESVNEVRMYLDCGKDIIPDKWIEGLILKNRLRTPRSIAYMIRVYMAQVRGGL